VAGFLASFGVAGLLGLEVWPLTGWRLFSELRHEHQVAVRAFVVRSDGTESGLPFWRLPPGYRGSEQVLQSYLELPEPDREAVCATWTSALRALEIEVTAIRVYRVEWDLSRRESSRAADPSDRTLLDTCLGEGEG
jgi:hypothetical protein